MSPTVITWSESVSLGPCVVAIGVFDGVHAGHRALLEAAAEDAARNSIPAVALTFDRDPEQVVAPERAVPQLMTLDDKCAALAGAGADVVLVVPFTEALAETPAQQFLDTVLGRCCDVRSIHVGADFRFGQRAAGTVDTLRQWARTAGAEVCPHELLEFDGAPVTSTRIRALIAEGDVAGAARLMGRAPRITGTVVVGRRQGSELGFPTANVRPAAFAALPADGVYAGSATLANDATYPAAISVGVPPTFPEARDYVEAHIIGFAGDLYGHDVRLDFARRLRAQRAFGSLEELTAAIAEDVRAATPDLDA